MSKSCRGPTLKDVELVIFHEGIKMIVGSGLDHGEKGENA
jgi:hypothetical protein